MMTLRIIIMTTTKPTWNLDIRDLAKNTNHLNISIIDMLGRNVNNIYSGSIVSGKFDFSWDGSNINGIIT